MSERHRRDRAHMIEHDLRRRGITDPRVLQTMSDLPRHRFVPAAERAHAYQDRALPLEIGQTISQPYMVAVMTQALGVAPQHRVLEIGTGSGYHTAVLARLAGQVFTMERIPDLQGGARAVLEDLGVENVTFALGDGSRGWPRHAPYDRIVVTAGAPDVPPPLKEQLSAEGGRLVIPVGDADGQDLLVVTREGQSWTLESLMACRFVPLVGDEGW